MKIIKVKVCLWCPSMGTAQRNRDFYCRETGKTLGDTFEQLLIIPPWCPLEDAPEVKDVA
jgi:hypothetical protein